MAIPVLIFVIVEIVLMLALPIVVALIFRRRWELPWKLFLAGAVTFIASQVVHIPLNIGIAALLGLQTAPLWQQAIILGLTAGVCEEGARYLVYRFWQKDARTWRQAIGFGLGHGGIEAALTALMVVITLVNVLVLSNMDLTQIDLPAGTMEQVQAFWDMPFYQPLLALAERGMAMLLHVVLSTTVLLCFTKQRLWPLGLAIVWHAFVNAVIVYVVSIWGIVAAEGVFLLLTLGSVAYLRWARGEIDANADIVPVTI